MICSYLDVIPGKKVEYKINERDFEQDGTRKHETFFLILDYGTCQWKKIKRTKKILI